MTILSVKKTRELPDMGNAQTYKRRGDGKVFTAIVYKDKVILDIRIPPEIKEFETEVPVIPKQFKKDKKGKLIRVMKKVKAKEILSEGSTIRLKPGDRLCRMKNSNDEPEFYFGVDSRLWEHYVVFEEPTYGSGKESKPTS